MPATIMQTATDRESLRLARRLYDQRRFAESERLCRAVLRRDPDQPEALSILGYLALKGGAIAIAIDCFQRLCELQPDNAGHRGALATTLRLAGHHEEALASQAACVALAPDDAEARQNLALQYAETGQLELARKTYEQVLGQAPLLGQAHYGLALIKKFTKGDPQIAQMKAALTSDQLDAANQARVAFSLGKACEDLGEFDDAFGYYESGNRIKRGLVSFDIGTERENTRRIMRTFSASMLEHLQGKGFESEIPVFIVGMPRSGSTLVEQIIDRHPEAHGAGELPNVFRAIEFGLHAQLPKDSVFPEAIVNLAQDAWADLGKAYVESILPLAPGARRIVDKQLFNYTLLGMLQLMLPGARIIHCVRDPLDTCVSCYTQNFGADRGFSCDLSELGQAYRAYQTIMEHWRQCLPKPMLDVEYERVVADPEAEARRLIDFLGLAWSDACLAHQQSQRAVVTSSLGQVRAPIYASSIGRWRRFESHLQPLIDALTSDA